MTSFDSDRRNILKAGGAALTLGLAGCSGILADGEGVPGKVDTKEPGEDGGNGNGNGSPVEDYLSDANEYDSVQDMTGQDEVTVEVGAGEGFAFSPAAIQVDPGTTVTWEWTGEGGQHNVVDEDGAFESELAEEAGHTFDHQFDEEGTVLYFCSPHKTLGMKGAVVVGSGGGGGGGDDPTAQVDEYLADANEYDSVQDMTGQDEVTVEVGAGEGFAFSPAAIQIDPGTTVTWEWTGEGGQHNVVDEDGAFESELVGEAGHTFDHQFDEEGTVLYFCQPHKTLGMKGAVVVGSGGGGGGEGTGNGADGNGDGNGAGNGNGNGGNADVEEYLSDANEYDGIADMTGQGEVTVEVGAGEGFAFSPAAIRVDSGTTVVWEWTGEGGQHNVVDEDGGFESDLVGEEGATFDQQFDESGTSLYFCQPHKTLGMKGAVVVE